MLWRNRFILFFLSGACAAQSYDGDAERVGQAELTRSGKLVNLVVQPGEKQIRLQVVAKDVAAIQVKDQVVEAYYGEGEQRQRVKLVRLKNPTGAQGNTYAFDRPSRPIDNLEISIRQGSSDEKFTIPRVR